MSIFVNKSIYLMNKKQANQIVIVGSSNTDMVVSCQRLPRPGETVLGGEFMMNPGGKGANQAVAVARLGGNVTFVGKVGDDVFGQRTCRQLQAEGIDISCLGVVPDCASGVALINVDADGENCITVASGANAMLRSTDIDAASDLIATADILLMQLEVPLPTVVHAARLAKSKGVKVVLNPAPAPTTPLPVELLENVDILIPNRTELELLSGLPCDETVSPAVDRMKMMGVKSLVVTLGSKGALICLDGKNTQLIPSFKVKAVDTTAAGDTFCAALCVALAEGKTIDEAVLFGNLAASLTVTRAGAQNAIPTRAEVDGVAMG